MPIGPTGTAYAAMEVSDPKITSRGLYKTSGNQYYEAGWPVTTGTLDSGGNFGLSGNYTMENMVYPYSNTTGTELCIGIFIRKNWAVSTARINDPNYRREEEILKFGVYRMHFIGASGVAGSANEIKESQLVAPVASGFTKFLGSVSGQVILGKCISPSAITGQYADILVNPMEMVY